MQKLRVMASELWLGSLLFALLIFLRLSVSPFTPTFAISDNPIARNANFFSKAINIPKLWCKHAYLLLFPNTLSFDWSENITQQLVTSVWEFGTSEVLVLGVACFGLVWRCFRGLLKNKAVSTKKECSCSKLDQLNNNCVPSCANQEAERRKKIFGDNNNSLKISYQQQVGNYMLSFCLFMFYRIKAAYK